MPARQGKHRRQRQPLWDASDPEGFGCCAQKYLEWQQVRAYSPRTVTNTENSLKLFFGWCSARSLSRPKDITKPILEGYQRHLFYWRKPDGKPMTFRSQQVRLVAVRGFFRWLVKQNILGSNPASDLELPRMPQRLPRDVLSAEEVERVLGEADVRTPIGIRDRAIGEVLYSTGIRRMELINLRITDIDIERGTLMVREGKGRKDRMVPLGERAGFWVQQYLENVRPELVMPPDEGALFLTSLGESPTPDWLTQRLRGYLKSSGVGKSGACHIFRHTMATLMLEGGADIRHIQEMLGHSSLESTEVYTRVSLKKLKAIHEATHPGAKLERPGVHRTEPQPPSSKASNGSAERR
jgi:integrase/recombinase XerD